MEALSNKRYTLKENDTLSFEIDNEILEQFKNLIYDLEENGVYMDFIWIENNTFTNDENKILHIVNNDNIKATWNDLSEDCGGYYKNSIVTVDLKNIPDIYFIFAPIILNKMTNIVFDFYEGEDNVYISFFKNRYMQSRKKLHNNTINETNSLDKSDNFESEVLDFINLDIDEI